MKTRIIILTALVALMLSNCLYSERVRGNGRSITFEENYQEFDELEFSNAIEAEIEYGDKYQIVVSIDENLEKYVKIEKYGSQLSFGLRSGVSYSNVNFKVHVTMPAVRKLDASGACELKVSGFKSKEDLTIDVSGATELDAFVNVGNLYLETSGASEIELIGSGKHLEIDGSGASDLDLSDFKVLTATVDMSGASELKINVLESLSVDLSGASEVKYYGNPQMKHISTSGASDIRSMDR
ncbi:MAG: head GIN domain-containing protein [Fidelibacterota bacterium]